MTTVSEGTPRVVRPVFTPDQRFIRGLNRTIPHLLRRKDTRCVDPRDAASIMDKKEREYAYDGVARPGGDFGYVMVLMGAYQDMKPERAVDIVHAWTAAKGRKFITHGDNHAHGSNCGCGHIDRAANGEGNYGIAPEKVRVALTYHQGKDVAHAENPKLLNNHEERVVIDNRSRFFTFPSKINGVYAFRYDRVADYARLKALARYLRKHGIDGDQRTVFQQLKQASDQQLASTLGLLAKDLPIVETRAFPFRRARVVGII